MGIAILQRAPYRHSSPVIHYVVDQRILVRARPSSVKNPRTAAQQLNRSKMGLASRFLAGFRDFVLQGFEGYQQPNGRRVGSYHAALGRLLGEAMVEAHGAWRIDYERVVLAEGNSLAPHPITVHRDGRRLQLEWKAGLPKGTIRVRLAVHSPRKHGTVCLEIAAPKRGRTVGVELPKWASAHGLQLWWQPVVRGAGQ